MDPRSGSEHFFSLNSQHSAGINGPTLSLAKLKGESLSKFTAICKNIFTECESMVQWKMFGDKGSKTIS
jgi:hypothetical protein